MMSAASTLTESNPEVVSMVAVAHGPSAEGSGRPHRALASEPSLETNLVRRSPNEVMRAMTIQRRGVALEGPDHSWVMTAERLPMGTGEHHHSRLG